MIVPVRVGESGKELKNPIDYAGWARADVNWMPLAQCLTFGRPDHTQLLATGLEKTCSLGATPFEVIAGTPQGVYGPRITFVLPRDHAKVLAGSGLSAHPWGPPQWIGLRIDSEGRLIAKAYHKLAKVDGLPFAASFIEKLSPVMASLHDGGIETYLPSSRKFRVDPVRPCLYRTAKCASSGFSTSSSIDHAVVLREHQIAMR